MTMLAMSIKAKFSMIFSALVLAALSLPEALADETTAPPATPPPAAPPADPNGYYLGGRAGVAVPIGTSGLAFPISLEAGVQFPSDLSLGVRFTFENAPPALFGRESPPWALGPIVDVRYLIPTNPNLSFYLDVGGGFLFGVNEQSGYNVVLPIATAGLGARITPGNMPIYVAPELGLTNFVIPYMGLAMGLYKPPG